MTQSRWLQGNFAPVQTERTVTDLAVSGAIPPELRGRYLRNGPNPFTAPDPATYHWFSGDGMVHGVRLRDGRALWYRNRWVRSPDVAQALGEPVRPSPFDGQVPLFAANTNVIGHAGRTFALVEAGAPPVELTYELETVGPTDLDGTLEHPFSAHPKRDPVSGELVVVAYWWGWGERLRYMVVGTDGRVRHSVDVAVAGQPMVHDTAITPTCAGVRPAVHLRSRRGTRGCGDPLPVEPQLRRPGGPCPPRGHSGRPPLVRGRAERGRCVVGGQRLRSPFGVI